MTTEKGEKINVSVLYTKFSPADKGDDFRILSVEGDGEVFGAKGPFGDVSPGTRIVMYGEWGKAYRGQKQFECAAFETILPSTVAGMEEYLASGAVSGCGPSMAKKIVEKFGEKTFFVLDNEPDRLIEINGIGEKKKERIKTSWRKQKVVQHIGQHLFSIGVPIRYMGRVRRALGDDAVKIIKENPYRLCDVDGISFEMADHVALRNEYAKEDPARIAYGLMYKLGSMCTFGDTYADYSWLARETSSLLDVRKELVDNAMMWLSASGRIVIEKDAVYRKNLYLAESGTAKKLLELRDSVPYSCREVPIEEIESKIGIEYDPEQKKAISAAVKESVLVITGGPGTGKSTILKGLLFQFERAGLTVKMAAPTGRAAKHMSEVTGETASTIHRMLLSASDGTYPDFGDLEDGDGSLDTDVVIIDETSMVDISLMSFLLTFIEQGMRLILIGDVDQLPSVGPGTVLRDIIRSGLFRTVRLEKTFRQKEGSAIIENAKAINSGSKNLVFNRKSCGAYFVRIENNAMGIEDKVVDLVSRQIPEKFGYSGEEIQVITPIRKKGITAGAWSINEKLQDALNPLKKNGLTVHGFREKDRVMNIRNNYSKDIFNGDIGTIREIDMENKYVVVDFDGNEVDYDFDELDDLMLCYAISVHKSQGAEYPAVVMPVTMAHYVMLQRTLFYTAVTRAKRLLVLVGETAAVSCAIDRIMAEKRKGRLYERLVGLFPEEGHENAAVPRLKAEAGAVNDFFDV